MNKVKEHIFSNLIWLKNLHAIHQVNYPIMMKNQFNCLGRKVLRDITNLSYSNG